MSDPAAEDERAETAADELLAELGEPSSEASAAGPEGGGRLAPGFGAEAAHEGLHD